MDNLVVDGRQMVSLVSVHGGEPLPCTDTRNTICLPSTTKLSRRNLKQHT